MQCEIDFSYECLEDAENQETFDAMVHNEIVPKLKEARNTMFRGGLVYDGWSVCWLENDKADRRVCVYVGFVHQTKAEARRWFQEWTWGKGLTHTLVQVKKEWFDSSLWLSGK